MKRAILAVLVSALFLPCGSVLADEVALDTEEKKTLYTLGYLLASKIGGFLLEEHELAAVQVGLRDGVLGAEPRVDLQNYAPLLDSLAKNRQQSAAGVEKTAGQAFLDEEAAKPGAVRLPTGMLYFEVLAGTGDSPEAVDRVKVHYHGTLRDGNVFDSSLERGPAEFPLGGVISCFRDGITRMKVGGKARLICPSDTAYGDGGRPGIPPGATLVFEVELLDIIRPETPAAEPPQSPTS
jgi:FKBP-type peptidyl-prolyl cis-trans isomerase